MTSVSVVMGLPDLSMAGGALWKASKGLGGTLTRMMIRRQAVSFADDAVVRVAPASGGFHLPGGGTGGNFARSAQVTEEVLAVAQSQQFIQRARALGFSEEVISQLPSRIRAYGGNIGETMFGGFANESQFLVGRVGLLPGGRSGRIAHELGHVLDDLANPGLFVRSGQPGFGFGGFYNAERVAYTMQYGYNPLPLTAFKLLRNPILLQPGP